MVAHDYLSDHSLAYEIDANPLVNRTLQGTPALGIISFLPKPGMPFRASCR